MSDAAKHAFKLGFLTRCAEEGLTGEKLDARLAQLEKTAEGWKDVISGVGDAGLAAGKLWYGLPIAAGLLGGGVAGWGTAKLTEPKLDEDQIKAQELAHTYRVYADRLKARRKAKEYRPGA